MNMNMTHPNPVLSAIFQRRSIRKYTDQPVESEKLELLLQAAMAAPSAMNSKPWEFVVITDSTKLAQCRKRLIFGNRNAPAAILVCGNSEASANRVAKNFWVQDCSAAIENILVAAVGLGLATVWIGIHPVKRFERTLREITGLPAEVTPLGLVYVGYGAEQKESRSQYDPERVHWQVYSPHNVELEPSAETASPKTTKE